MAKQQIPLKEIMAAIDKKDRDWYVNLPEEKKKLVNMWMMMRYASSVQGKHAAEYIFFVNELINKDFADVSKHPELQWLLLTACGQGKVEFHPYIKPPNSRKKKNPLKEWLCELYPHLKLSDIDLLIEMNTPEDFRELAISQGLDDKSIKEIVG